MVIAAGVDEAGRGPLAGPVVAAAVVMDPQRPIAGLADSKTISESRRQILAAEITEHALCWALGEASAAEIDELNILAASLLAMKRAVAALETEPGLVLVDGPHSPSLQCEVKAIVRGDSTVPSISAASILAKVSRDALMVQLAHAYPDYGFQRHKGYPTREHLRALARHGATPQHRRSFRPVKRHLETPGSGR